MKRSSLAAATVAALAATALGSTSSTAVAAPARASHGTTTNPGPQHLRHAQRRVQREIEHREEALARVAGSRNLARLAADDATAVRANLAADRATLAALADQLPATTTMAEILDLATQVRAVHPQTYELVVADLRRAARFQDRLDGMRPAVTDLVALLTELQAGGDDVETLSRALEAVNQACDLATTAVTTARELARSLVASSSQDDVHAVLAALASAGDALEVAEEQLDAVREGLEAA